MRGVGGAVAITDDDLFDLGAEGPIVLHALGREPIQAGTCATERAHGEDRDTRPPAPRRGQETKVEVSHLGQELATADECNGTGHPPSLAMVHERTRRRSAG
jgi:hypothetical protein